MRSSPSKSAPEGELHDVDQLTLSAILDMKESDQLITNELPYMNECNPESAAILEMNMDLSSDLNEFNQTKTNTAAAILNLDDTSILSANHSLNSNSNSPSSAYQTCSNSNKSLNNASNCRKEVFTVDQLYNVKLEDKIRNDIFEKIFLVFFSLKILASID